MPVLLFLAYYLSIVIAATTGIVKWKYIDNATKFLIMLMMVTAISECCCYIAFLKKEYIVRSAIYHVYNVIQAILFSAFFIKIIKPYHHGKYLITISIIWIAAGCLNAIFLQPLRSFNSNILIIESFIFITSSLTYVYISIKATNNQSLLSASHVQLTGIILALWSGTFFFWSTIHILFRLHWVHTPKVLSAQLVFNMLVYLGFATVFFFYPKNQTPIENI